MNYRQKRAHRGGVFLVITRYLKLALAYILRALRANIYYLVLSQLTTN